MTLVRCKILLTALVTVVLLSLSSNARAQTTHYCSQYAPIAISNGYNVQNDFYDQTGGTLCTDVNTSTGAFTVDNTNSTPTNGSPGGYPSTYVGCHFGTCSSYGGGMPIQLSVIGAATSSWNVTPATSGAWDIAYDIWFNQTPTTSGQPNNQPNGTEIMIWLNHAGGVQPAGSSTGQTVTVNGIAFTPWIANQISFCGCGTKWNVVSYVANTPVSSVSNLNLLSFFQDAVNRSQLQNAWYLIDVEAGTEAWQGDSGFKSNSFSATITHK